MVNTSSINRFAHFPSRNTCNTGGEGDGVRYLPHIGQPDTLRIENLVYIVWHVKTWFGVTAAQDDATRGGSRGAGARARTHRPHGRDCINICCVIYVTK